MKLACALPVSIARSSTIRAAPIFPWPIKALARASNLATPKELAAIQEAVASLKSAMTSVDHRAIRAAIEKVDKATHSLAEKLMNSTLQEALKDKKLSDV